MESTLDSNYATAVGIGNCDVHPFLRRYHSEIALTPIIRLTIKSTILTRISGSFCMLRHVVRVNKRRLALVNSNGLGKIRRYQVKSIINIIIRCRCPREVIGTSTPKLQHEVGI